MADGSPPTQGAASEDGLTVLVTGGLGYIGSVLVPLLQEDPRVGAVRIFDNQSTGSPRNLVGVDLDGEKPVRMFEGDVRDFGAVEAATRGAEVVVHLAAVTGAESTHDRPEETFAINYDGTENVLGAAEKYDLDRFVFASSCNLYGRASTADITEATEPDPLNPYAESKHEAEQLLRSARTGGLSATALRMSTNHGYAPGVRFNLVVNYFVFRALTGRPLTVYGDGSNWRPFIHVEDAARAFKHAALQPAQYEQLVYNVGANRENYRISEVAQAVREELDRDLEITYLEDEKPGPSYHVTFDRLEADTDFTPEWELRNGIRDLAARFQGEASIGRASRGDSEHP